MVDIKSNTTQKSDYIDNMCVESKCDLFAKTQDNPAFSKLRFLNQARAWFLKIVPVRMCVCLSPRLLITSGMILTSCDWLNKFYSCYMAIVVVIVNGCGLGIGMCHTH